MKAANSKLVIVLSKKSEDRAKLRKFLQSCGLWDSEEFMIDDKMYRLVCVPSSYKLKGDKHEEGIEASLQKR